MVGFTFTAIQQIRCCAGIKQLKCDRYCLRTYLEYPDTYAAHAHLGRLENEDRSRYYQRRVKSAEHEQQCVRVLYVIIFWHIIFVLFARSCNILKTLAKA